PAAGGGRPPLPCRAARGPDRGDRPVRPAAHRASAPAPTSPFTLAVCAEMVHTDLPLVERIRRIGAHGAAAEIWDWSRPEVDLEQIAATGVPVLSMTGYLHGTGLDPHGLPVRPVETVTGSMWTRALRTLERIAALGEELDVVFELENLNRAVDHPGTPFARP